MRTIGIITGSGLEDLSGSFGIKELEYNTHVTTYGLTSPIAEFETTLYKVYLVSRHGTKHGNPPHLINYAANISYLSQVCCKEIISVTACGSLRPHLKIGDLVLPDQFIDHTNQTRVDSIYRARPLNLQHVAMGKPLNQELRKSLYEAGHKAYPMHYNGTVITINGPRFSSAAESRMFQLWGADIINMTSSSEIVLANELKIPIAVIGMVTDFDSWKDDAPHATWEEIRKTFGSNREKVLNILWMFLNTSR